MKLVEAEDSVKRFLHGGGCTDREHVAATHLEKLVMLKMLRLEYPHQSTSVSELESAIRKELKKDEEQARPQSG